MPPPRSGLDWPLRIDEATVRWVDKKTFGIAFTRLRSEERAKLETVLAKSEFRKVITVSDDTIVDLSSRPHPASALLPETRLT